MALLEKTMANNKPNDNNSFRGWFKKSFKNPMMIELFLTPGTISLIKEISFG